MLLNNGSITQSPAGDYTSAEGGPWHINSEAGCVKSVFYRRSFFPLSNNGDLWSLSLKEFEVEINKFLQPTTENDSGDKLVVVFRDAWVAIAGMIRDSEQSTER